MHRLLCAGLIVLVWLCQGEATAGPLRADRLNKIIRLLSDNDMKVRLQAVFVLGKLRDGRSVPALINALNDKNHTVRSLAAYALGQIGDSVAVRPLSRRRGDRHPQVRRHVRAALQRIKQARKKPTAAVAAKKARFLLRLRSMSAKTDNGRPLIGQLRKEWAKIVGATSGMAVTQGTKTRRGQKMFEITSTITELIGRRNGAMVAMTCRVSVVVGSATGSILMMGSGGATVEVSRPSPRQTLALRSNALELAVQSAHKNLVRFLRTR